MKIKIALFFCIVLLASCVSSHVATPTDISVPIQSLDTLEPTFLATVTPTLAVQLTPASEENLVTATSYPLTLTEKTKKIEELLKTNARCELPCWWGVNPGETTWKNAQEVLAPVSLLLNQRETGIPSQRVYDLAFPNPIAFNSSSADMKMTVLVQDEIVREMRVEIISSGVYSQPSRLLRELDKPSETFLGGEIDPYNRTYYFEVAFYYPERGVFSIFGNREDLTSNSILQVCFDTLTYNALYLWSPNNSFEERMKLIFSTSGIKFLAIENATPLTSEKIYSDFTTTEKPCVSTVAEIWPGYLK